MGSAFQTAHGEDQTTARGSFCKLIIRCTRRAVSDDSRSSIRVWRRKIERSASVCCCNRNNRWRAGRNNSAGRRDTEVSRYLWRRAVDTVTRLIGGDGTSTDGNTDHRAAGYGANPWGRAAESHRQPRGSRCADGACAAHYHTRYCVKGNALTDESAVEISRDALCGVHYQGAAWIRAVARPTPAGKGKAGVGRSGERHTGAISIAGATDRLARTAMDMPIRRLNTSRSAAGQSDGQGIVARIPG